MIINPTQAHAIEKIVAHLKKGELVAIPTETVYGLAADATNETAIKKIFYLKNRPLENPLIVHLADAQAMTKWGRDIPTYAWQLAENFWPGPLSLIVPKAKHVSDLLTAQQASVGLRVPNHPVALAILAAFDEGLAAPSANPFMRISPTQASHVAQYFPDTLWIVDGGNTQVGLESTIIDCTGPQPILLRHGAITPKQIEETLGFKVLAQQKILTKHAGQAERHYAPLTQLKLMDFSMLQKTLVALSDAEKKHKGVLIIHDILANPLLKCQILLSQTPSLYGRELYRALHALDAAKCEEILVELPPQLPEWQAIHERLRKAAEPPGGA